MSRRRSAFEDANVGCRRRAPRGRPAFTLVEMLISLAVLALALSVVGVVFTVTTQTATQAAAFSEAQNWVREFVAQVEEDLRFVDPASSMLVLVGRTQAAAIDEPRRQAGQFFRVLVGDPASVPNGFDPRYATNNDPATTQYSDPRADLLMFFSNRASVSQAAPEAENNNTARALRGGAKMAPIQVVYGHAAFDDAIPVGSTGDYEFAGNLRHIELPGAPRQISRIPASRWHLSRRVALLSATDPAGSGAAPPSIDLGFARPSGIMQSLTRCVGSASLAGDVVQYDLPALLASFSAGGQLERVTEPQQPYSQSLWPHPFTSRILYGPGGDSVHHVATVLENPPANLRSNLGVQMLPGCVWFQVEFLMPEDPRNHPEYDPVPADPNDLSPNQSQRFDPPLWTQVPAGQTFVFLPDTLANRAAITPETTRFWEFGSIHPDTQASNNDPANRRIRMWPYAIRITVRVTDPKGRLPDPVVRTIVKRFD